MKHFITAWEKLTKDQFVLNCVKGCKINFSSSPIQYKKPSQLKFNVEETKALNTMISQLEKDKVIEKCTNEEGDFTHNVFLVKKNTEELKYRCILNMKPLNKEHVELTHFKMDTLNSCLLLMTKDCCMASIDISNAYHHIPIHPDHAKYLKFAMGEHTYRYLTLPQGYRDSPRIFTKTLKPLLQHIREKGVISSIYIDDLYIQGKDIHECKQNVMYTTHKLKELGFMISDKSVFTPTQTLCHLGFILNSITMTVKLSDKKREKVINMCLETLKLTVLSIRKMAQIIGTLVACFPAIQYGPLFYRDLEREKSKL